MGKLIDMTGWKMWEHGVPDSRWTVLQKADSRNGQIYWLCECSCEEHTKKIVKGSDLRCSKGGSKSCGCLMKQKTSKLNKKDLSGQSFGKWKVIREDLEAERGSGKHIKWICECQCEHHTIASIPGNRLRNGGSTQCTLCQYDSHAIYQPGQKIGHLTILKKVPAVKKDGFAWWLCECDCNSHSQIKVSSRYLTQSKEPSCGCVTGSMGERKIQTLLHENNIIFEKEKTFPGLVNEKPLRFDFFLPEQHYLIEYDGEQHFKEGSWSNLSRGINLLTYQKRDEIKNKWCEDNNIPLIRIPYTHYNNLCIEDLLLETSKFIVCGNSDSSNQS